MPCPCFFHHRGADAVVKPITAGSAGQQIIAGEALDAVISMGGAGQFQAFYPARADGIEIKQLEAGAVGSTFIRGAMMRVTFCHQLSKLTPAPAMSFSASLSTAPEDCFRPRSRMLTGLSLQCKM